jgi:regulator of sigma E protease
LESSREPDRSSGLVGNGAVHSAASAEEAASQPRGWFLRNGLYIALPIACIFFLSYRYDLDLSFWSSVGVAALGLGLIIFIHELGHFLVAKWCDVHVEAFSIGFGPPLPGCCFKWGETTYMIALFPLGGYVKMVGEGQDNDESDTDPRSFKNKTVWQRMAIISAGVVMNLLLALGIFAFVFLTKGDEQSPGVVANVDPGSPAWVKGVRSGDVVYWIGDQGPQPTFQDHILPTVMNSTAGESLRFVYGRPNAPEEKRVQTQIVPRREDDDKKPAIGVGMPHQLTLPPSSAGARGVLPYVAGSAASRGEPVPPAEKGFLLGDEIIGSTDPANRAMVTELPNDPRGSGHRDYFEFRQRMVQLAGQPATIRVRREGTEQQADVRVPPAFHYTLGLIMRMGQITAVRENSPAAAAGVKPGDIIDHIEVRDGNERIVFGHTADKDVVNKPLDPDRLPFQLASWAARQPEGAPKEVSLTVLRKNHASDHAEKQHVKLVLAWDDSWKLSDDEPGLRSPLAIQGLGVAFRVETKVEGVVPGSPAERAGIQKDDVIKAVRFFKTPTKPDETPEPERWYSPKPDQWAGIFTFLQNTGVKKLEVRLERDKLDLTLQAVEDPTWPLSDRGLLLMPNFVVHRASSVGEAIGMGVTKTKNFIVTIYGNLKGLATGRISRDQMSGPIGIAKLAFDFAEDPYRFLVLIGIISVNLAVFNFLPIPVLDGGHMMFLLYEKLRGRPAPEIVRTAATFVGVGFILLLMCYVIFQDVDKHIFQLRGW